MTALLFREPGLNPCSPCCYARNLAQIQQWIARLSVNRLPVRKGDGQARATHSAALRCGPLLGIGSICFICGQTSRSMVSPITIYWMWWKLLPPTLFVWLHSCPQPRDSFMFTNSMVITRLLAIFCEKKLVPECCLCPRVPYSCS